MLRSARPLPGWCAACLVVACQAPTPPQDTTADDSAANDGVPGKRPGAKAAVDKSGYLLPPDDVVKIVDAPPTPSVRVGPRGRWLMLSPYEALPPIEVVAEPFLRLAGMRINPAINGRRQLRTSTGISFQALADGAKVAVSLPDGARIGSATWSPDGSKVALGLSTGSGYEPWIVQVASGEAKRLSDRKLNDVLGSPLRWMPDSSRLLARVLPQGHGTPPESPSVPRGPVVQDTAGAKAQNRTYQDLLQNPHDEDLFAYFGTSVLAILDASSGSMTTLGEPALISDADPAPDGEHVLVQTIKPPFSYAVPYYRFAHTVEVWDTTGKKLHTVADLPVADQVPIEGVPTGPRSVEWKAHHPATLIWNEALDGGDPNVEAEHRDKIMEHAAPFGGEPTELLKVQHRSWGADFTGRKDELFVTEYDRDRRWITTRWHRPGAEPRVLFDRSRNDRYGDPGRPVRITLPDGMSVVRVEDGHVYLSGDGATPEGDRPFLDRMKLEDGAKERLFAATAESYASFVDFVGDGGKDAAFIVRREDPKTPPNYFVVSGGEETAITEFPDPHPQLTGISKKLLTYKRKDGVPLSGTLYLPPGHDGKEKLPLLIWAYPREYNDKGTAGQVQATPNRFTRLAGTSPLMALTQGYAVLDGATMPVVGDPKTMNDTFLPQIVDAARAAIDAVAAEGVADRDRVAIAGHSYGAFMAANLLAHSDLFKAGIARSGAYNRSLTPFGFQSERRTLWEATDAYINVSPMFAAHKIDEPILMIHGEADNNSGTFPIQSRRLFHALKGLGGTARLVMLPHESHGYRARESVLHVLAETFAWLDDHVKNPGSRDPETKAVAAAGAE